METIFEKNEQGEQVKVTTLDSGHVIRELYREPSETDVRQAEILAQLGAIDAATDSPRTRRELMLGSASTKAWLQVQDDKAAKLRTQLGRL